MNLVGLEGRQALKQAWRKKTKFRKCLIKKFQKKSPIFEIFYSNMNITDLRMFLRSKNVSEEEQWAKGGCQSLLRVSGAKKLPSVSLLYKFMVSLQTPE